MSDPTGADARQVESDNVGLLGGEELRTGFVVLTTGEAKAVQYAVVDDRAVFEGDIVLGTVDEMERMSGALAGQAQAGDEQVVHGVVITGEQYRWPNALMPYEVDPTLPNQQRITDAVAHWHANTNVRLMQRTAANAAQYPNYVRVIPSDGCWSHVGMRGGRQDIGLAGGCEFGATVHEFGHAWGLWHEQSREDRDAYITIHWENIEAGREHNFNQHISDGDDVGAYDYGSLMHYGRFAFTKNNQPTITPKQSGVTIGQRNGLSADDIAAVHHMYRTWHHNKGVAQTYATHHSRNAWVNLVGLGWRRIHPDASDGVTEVFAQCVWARAYNRNVTVFADGVHVYYAYLL